MLKVPINNNFNNISLAINFNNVTTRHTRTFIAVVDLEPSGVLYVCHGGAMSVTCRTSADLLQWNVTLRHPSPQRMFERTLSANFGTIRMEQPIITNLTTLSISRSLDNSSHLPLISTISTDNVTTDLNGTVITCSGISMMMELPATDNVEVIILTGMRNIRNIINNGRHVHTHNINI